MIPSTSTRYLYKGENTPGPRPSGLLARAGVSGARANRSRFAITRGDAKAIANQMRTAATRRIAIATLWDGVPDYACAVMHYCQHAQRLAHAISQGVDASSADLLMMLTSDHVYAKSERQCHCRHAGKHFCPECPAKAGGHTFDPSQVLRTDCPQMIVHKLDPILKEAVTQYVSSPSGGCRAKWQTTVLYKWWVASLVDYSLVILADLDVQLLRPEQSVSAVAGRWRRTWDYAVPPNGRSRVFSEGDHWTPFNGGLWTLSHPSQDLYNDGLALLRRGRWNTTHGFNFAGTPREHQRRLPALQARMKKTTMMHRNTWDVPFGDCDQGFLFHMFYLHTPRDGGQPIGVDFEAVPDALDCRPKGKDALSDTEGRCPHTARHYWGPKKPWQLEKDNRGRVAHYLAHTNFSSNLKSECAALFTRYIAQLPQVDAKARPPSKSNGKLQRVR